MRHMLQILSVGIATVAAAGQTITTADRIEAHVAFLADDALGGRDAGTPEYEIAARYVATQFRLLGLQPAGDGGYLQSVPMLRNQLDPESATFRIQADKQVFDLVWSEDFLMPGDAVREETSVTAGVVFVGWGVVAPELGHDDYVGLDVEGRIILLLTGAPTTFPHNQRAYYSSSRTKRELAVERGAVGMIAFQTAEDQERRPWQRITRNAGRPGMRWLADDGTASSFSPEIEGSAFLGPTGASKLLGSAGEDLEEILVAASEGRAEGFELPVEVTLERRTTHEKLPSSNVASVLPGSDPELAGEYVVFSAHLDHIGLGAPADGDKIYNGAYDNAMGVAVMLEVARLLAESSEPPRRSILFLALTGEEKGLLGSDYFTHHPTVPRDSLVANVNLDMPLFLFPIADIIAFGAEHSSLSGPVRKAAEAVGFQLSPDPIPHEVLFIRSDQYSFVRHGVPAVFLVSGVNSSNPEISPAEIWQSFLDNHYHMPSDDISRAFDRGSAERFTQTNYLIGLEIANASERPVWNEGDFFGEKFGRRE